MTEPAEPSLAKFVDDLTDYAKYQKERGIRSVELDPKEVAALAELPKPGVTTTSLPPAKPGTTAPATSASSTSLEALADRIKACTLCPLCESRTHTVPGQGSPTPEIIFIGEGPGATEDEQGLAFVGRAGQLLTKMIEAMGLTREEVWIGNIVKCRPPGNRVPLPDEMEACMPYLKEQLALLKPKVIVCLGATAVKGLLDVKTGITKLRGTWMSFEGVDVMPTFHPAYLLRNPPGKKDVWQDLQAVMERVGRPVPEKK